MHSLLRNRNSMLETDVIDFTQELVRTASPSLEEEGVAARVEAKMQEAGYDEVLRDDAGNVVGIMHGRDSGPVLLLNCHMDTADVGREPSAEDGRVVDGRLVGSGASDCKSGLAAQIFAGLLLKRSLLPLEGSLVVAATVAQENGGSAGVRALLGQTLRELQMTPTYAILGDPTDLGLYYGHDGWAELEVRVESANPFHVDDAVAAIVQDLNSSHRVMHKGPAALAVHNPRFADVSGHRRATIQVDRRLNAAEELEEMLHQMKHNASLAAGGTAAVAVDVAVRQEKQQLYTGRTTLVQRITNAWSIDPFHTLMERSRQALAAANCNVRPGKWELGRPGMGTAGGVLVTDFQIPTIGYGPGSENAAHTAEEDIAVAKIPEAVLGTAVIAHSLIGVPVYGWTSDEI